MKQLKYIIGFALLMGLQFNAIAAEDGFIDGQAADANTAPPSLTPEEAEAKREKVEAMATETLVRLYTQNPEAQAEVEGAYGYGVFEGHVVNMVLYVAGKGFGVVYDKETHTPVYMNAVRAGTGPGVGYKASHMVLIFKNDTVYNQFTTVGLHASASGDAVMKLAGKEAGGTKSASLVPGISMYQLLDSGLVLQANWGATEFLKDAILNTK